MEGIMEIRTLTGPAVGDTVLLCEGVALSKVEKLTEEVYVPGHTR